jgi:hypothetical protein
MQQILQNLANGVGQNFFNTPVVNRVLHSRMLDRSTLLVMGVIGVVLHGAGMASPMLPPTTTTRIVGATSQLIAAIGMTYAVPYLRRTFPPIGPAAVPVAAVLPPPPPGGYHPVGAVVPETPTNSYTEPAVIEEAEAESDQAESDQDEDTKLTRRG